MQILRDIMSFIFNLTINIYVFVLITRTILLWRHAERINPLIQFITKLTNPVIKPCKKIIPDYQGVEIASISLIVIIELVKFCLLSLINWHMPQPVGLLLATTAEILRLIFSVFFYAVFLQALGTLMRNKHYNTYMILDDLTWPTINFFRRFTPRYHGIDFAPLVTLIVLQLILIVLINPLLALGLKLNF